MRVTVIYKDREFQVANAVTDGERLWLTPGELRTVAGLERAPGDTRTPQTTEPVAMVSEAQGPDDGRVDLVAVARRLGQPVVGDPTHGVWVVGESASARGSALRSLEAPDFSLPDLEGRRVSLSRYRGQKVFLVTWASW